MHSANWKQIQNRIDALIKDLQEKQQEINEICSLIHLEKKKLMEEKRLLEEINKQQSSKIKLEIGQHQYITSKQTLLKNQDSIFSIWFSDKHKGHLKPLKKSHESDVETYFIDRDGKHFPVILEYLRDGVINLESNDEKYLNEILKEARFYRVKGIEEAVEARLAQNKKAIAEQLKEQGCYLE